MEIALLISFIAFLKKAVDFCRYAANWQGGGKNGVITQFFAWAGGALGGVIVYTQSFAEQIHIAGQSVGKMSAVAQGVLGAFAISIGSVWQDYQKARDNAQSAKIPSLTKSKTVVVDSEKQVVSS